MSQRFPLTLAQLTYFAACAKTLNMTEASGELHVAQSAISTAIANLENALGTTLFIRQHSKGLVLTPAGESLFRDSQRIFGLLSETIDTIRSDRHDVSGTVTIASFHTLTPFLLPQLLAKLQAQHPALTVEVREGDYEQNIADLRAGRAEIALSYDLTEAEGVSQVRIGSSRPHVVLPTSHPLATRPSITLHELQDEPFVLLDLPDSSEYFLSLLAEAGISPTISYRTKNYEAVRSLVAMGLGFSILNQRPAIDSTYTGHRVAAVDLEGDLRSLHITLATLSQVTVSARARAVAAAVRELRDERPELFR